MGIVPVTGGCLCGGVRYASDAPPDGGYYCHCTICRKAYGGLFGAFVRFGGGALRFTAGAPAFFRSSTIARRGFCAACGSGLSFTWDGNPAVWITHGSLDRPEDWPMTDDATWGPSVHACVETRLPWLVIRDGLEQRPSTAMPGLTAARAHAARTQQA
jgi:hypothetical protein